MIQGGRKKNKKADLKEAGKKRLNIRVLKVAKGIKKRVSRKKDGHKKELRTSTPKTKSLKHKAVKVEREKMRNKSKEEVTVINQRKSGQEKVDRDKRLIMWTGVTFFMLLIVVVWIFSMKYQLEQVRIENSNSESSQDWRELSDEVGEKMAEIISGFKKIKSFEQNAELGALPEAGFNDSLFSTSTDDVLDQNGLDELIDLLEEESGTTSKAITIE